MPQITWKNIETPNFRGVAYAAGLAAQQTRKAFDPLHKVFADVEARNEYNFKNQTKQNTLDLEAKLRSAGNIDELDSQFDPAILREKFGAAYDAESVEDVRKAQRAKLKDEGTDNFLTKIRNESTLPRTNAEIAALLNNVDPTYIDKDKAFTSLTQGLSGRQEDTDNVREQKRYAQEQERYAQEQKRYVREQAQIATTEANKKGINAYYTAQAAGKNDQEAIAAGIDTAGSSADMATLMAGFATADVNVNRISQQRQHGIKLFAENAANRVVRDQLQIQQDYNDISAKLEKSPVISKATQDHIATMVDKETGLPSNPSSMLKKELGGTFMLRSDPDQVVDDVLSNLNEATNDPEISQGIMWEAFRNITQSDHWNGRDMDQKAFINETARLQQKYIVQQSIQEKLVQYQNLMKELAVLGTSEVKRQVLERENPKLKGKVNQEFDSSFLDERINSYTTEIKALSDSLDALDTLDNSVSTTPQQVPETIKKDTAEILSFMTNPENPLAQEVNLIKGFQNGSVILEKAAMKILSSAATLPEQAIKTNESLGNAIINLAKSYIQAGSPDIDTAKNYGKNK